MNDAEQLAWHKIDHLLMEQEPLEAIQYVRRIFGMSLADAINCVHERYEYLYLNQLLEIPPIEY